MKNKFAYKVLFQNPNPRHKMDKSEQGEGNMCRKSMQADLSLARHIKFHYPGHQSQEPATQVTYSHLDQLANPKFRV